MSYTEIDRNIHDNNKEIIGHPSANSYVPVPKLAMFLALVGEREEGAGGLISSINSNLVG